MQEKLFLFGTGKISTKYTILFNRMSVDIEGYIDNDQNKWGTEFQGKRVYSPDILYQISTSGVFIACLCQR